MKIKLDENLSQSLCGILKDLGHSADTVLAEDLSGSSDANIVRASLTAGRILFTLDTGFLDLKAYPPGSHNGIVVFSSAYARRIKRDQICDRLCSQRRLAKTSPPHDNHGTHSNSYL